MDKLDLLAKKEEELRRINAELDEKSYKYESKPNQSSGMNYVLNHYRRII